MCKILEVIIDFYIYIYIYIHVHFDNMSVKDAPVIGRLICPEGRVSSLNKCNPIQMLQFIIHIKISPAQNQSPSAQIKSCWIWVFVLVLFHAN